MAEKDIAGRMLESYNDVFADIVNGLLFEGRPVAEDIILQPTRGNLTIKTKC